MPTASPRRRMVSASGPSCSKIRLAAATTARARGLSVVASDMLGRLGTLKPLRRSWAVACRAVEGDVDTPGQRPGLPGHPEPEQRRGPEQQGAGGVVQRIVERHRAGMELTLGEPRREPDEEREVRRQREGERLPPATAWADQGRGEEDGQQKGQQPEGEPSREPP